MAFTRTKNFETPDVQNVHANVLLFTKNIVFGYKSCDFIIYFCVPWCAAFINSPYIKVNIEVVVLGSKEVLQIIIIFF